ncbi:LOW QUALITY PROTEIN: toll-like receptor 13 [Stegodyphus dumicola]|uniref:LOW QUALITY PROTEIN: toll-like receptor 13 n=1 Tax=Stegodyphus dumicola TaxID=202533 RepID=UPI0015AE0573|nr:LOW QUALITY PROTEIN: toll-like receptor 13 [Stegodyphus dumicola]
MLGDIEEFAFETLSSLLLLDLQGNNLRFLNNYIFFGLQNLRHLYLSGNNLFLLKDIFLHQLPLLSTLLLQDNKIEHFPNKIFSSLSNLYILTLTGNKIVPWNSKLFHPNLTIRILGLSRNQITHITPTMVAEFGQVSEYLDLRKNPFNCSACGMKDFQAFFKDLTFTLPSEQIDNLSYICVEPVFLQNQPFESVDLPVVNCETEEAALIGLFAIALICFVVLFATVVSLLCFFFRWYIRYWFFHFRAKMNEWERSTSYESRYKYDAFLSYNSANTPWVITYLIPALEDQEPKFKLCVHERDFQVGSLITENILEAIDASRKVILILSDSFIKSEWCMFELHMAQHKLFYDTRDGLILVKLEDVSKKLYSKNLLYLEKTRLCLKWKEDTLSQKVFWERLQKALGPPISNKILTSENINDIRMKFLDFVTIFLMTDVTFMCLSDNILSTQLDIINHKQKQTNEPKYFSQQDANGIDQVSLDMTKISNVEISTPTVNSSITSIQFKEKQNVPKANEESHIFTKGSNTSEISSNFRSNRNFKSYNFSHSDDNTKGLTYESSEYNSTPRMKVEICFLRNLVLLNSFPYDALKFLQNTTIFRLDLGYNYFPAVEIFPYIPSLESLFLPRCSIQDIKSGAFKDLPNLKELVLNNHELIEFPSEIARSINLEILDLHHQISLPDVNFYIKDFIFENMKQLEQLNLAHVSLYPMLSRYAFFGLYNLKLLILGATMLEAIYEYAFETLTSLLVLDLQGNNLRYLKNYTFFGLQNLKHLYLSRNNLVFIEKYLPFHPVPLLNVLYIEENKIEKFPDKIFSSLTDLKSLYSSKNKIVPWNSKIFHPNLTIMTLGLSENQIIYITPTMLTEFGQVSEYLDLRRNPFNCSACGMKDFQAFFRDSNLTFSLPDEEIDDSLYTCVEPVFLQNQPLGNVELPVVNCEVEEAALIGLLGIAIICFVTLFTMLVLLACFFFRWYIRYCVFHIQAKMKEKKYSHAYEPRYNYDAFLSYNSANTPWVVTYLIPALEVQEPKFKLCVHERDFQVGSLITENILEAIETSRKVILILSESFTKSEWCMFELHMAQHKLFDDTRDGLILVKLENINKKLYTKNLLYLEKTRLCLEWTENTLGQKLFWERMRKALGPPISNKSSEFDAVIA